MLVVAPVLQDAQDSVKHVPGNVADVKELVAEGVIQGAKEPVKTVVVGARNAEGSVEANALLDVH